MHAGLTVHAGLTMHAGLTRLTVHAGLTMHAGLTRLTMHAGLTVHAGLVCDVADTDCSAHNGSNHGRVLATFNGLVLIKQDVRPNEELLRVHFLFHSCPLGPCCLTVRFASPSGVVAVVVTGIPGGDDNGDGDFDTSNASSLNQSNESTHKGVNSRSKDVTQAQQKRPELPSVALTWHAFKYKVHKLHQRYILKKRMSPSGIYTLHFRHTRKHRCAQA